MTIETIMQNIDMLVLDVDGILTNGTLSFDPIEECFKSFHAQDGLGIKLLQQHQIKVAVISGRQSAIVKNRLHALGVETLYLGYEDKLPAWNDLLQTSQIKPESIAYMGDDLPDIPLLKRAGLAITVPNAADHVSGFCDYQTQRSGGMGAVREVCDRLLIAKGHWTKIIEELG